MSPAQAATPLSAARVTMVVDRDRRRGLDLAVSLAAATTAATGANPGPAQVLVLRAAGAKLDERRAVELTAKGARVVPIHDEVDDEAELLAEIEAAVGTAAPCAAVVLDNVPRLHDHMLRLRRAARDILVLTAYPTYRPGVSRIVASPTPNAFTWSSLYQTLVDAKGQPALSKSGFTEQCLALRDGEMLLCQPEAAATSAGRWSVSRQQVAC